MNINKKYLYEEFININLKYRYRIFDFIDKNCPISSKKKTQVLYEKIKDFKSKDQNEIKERKARILKDIKLHDYNKITIFNECERCDLCKYKTFIKVKKKLLDIQDDIFNKNIKVEKVINDFIEDLEYFNYKIIKDGRGKFSLQEGDTLKQIIYFNFIENISEKINAIFQKKNEYFRQIAKLLLVNNDFLEDFENIRDQYFYPRTYEDCAMYHPVKEFQKVFSKFQNEILELRDGYNLTQRWEPYMLQGMLIYPIDNNGELVVPENRPIPKPPDGKPGRMQILMGGKKLPEEPILVGDESEDMVKTFAKKHNVKVKDYFRTKDYKQPLRNFDRNFRWYREYQERIKDKGIKIKDAIFSEIFLDDIYNYPKDWQEPDYANYREKPDELSEDLKDDIEIGGANRIKAVIYRLDNLVYKKEK